MDDKTIEALSGLVRAVKALSKSVERGLNMGWYQGTGDTVVKQYRALQAKALQILPDDYYVKEVFAPELIEASDEEKQTMQIRLVLNQLEDYLRGILRDETEQRDFLVGDEGNPGAMGKELQEQILNITRKTLKRALSQIDIGSIPEPPEPPEPPIPPIPPEPPDMPIPPVPPTPPRVPGR